MRWVVRHRKTILWIMRIITIILTLAFLAFRHWAGEPVRVRAMLRERLEARAKPGPCALPLEEVLARMRFHGTNVAYCDGQEWKFPRGRRVCRLWAK